MFNQTNFGLVKYTDAKGEERPMFNQRNFAPVKYTDAKGEERPMYNLTKEGCLCLVRGF